MICGYILGESFYEYASDLSEQAIETMFNNFISKLLKYSSIKSVYAHNLSGFDGILLLKYLINYPNSKVNPIIFNGKLMGISFRYRDSDKTISIKFKDSYLLLPMPLRKLCNYFKVETAKTYFPFLLSDINYIGPFPDFNLFTQISIEK